ncbi:MAG: hypothetical protein R2828_21435 [Saprospiraceae bacterium]
MSFGKYQFLSWARRGISAKISESDTLGVTPGNAVERASLQVNVSINAETPQSQPFILLGPGDITGIKKEMIIRTEPLNEIADYEPNLLPYIEFYDEDFPWRYTPASAVGDGDLWLRPWLALIVLKEGEFEETKRREPLSAIKILNPAALPPTNELHLWAHMHTNLQFEADQLDQFVDSLEEDAKTDPDGVYSRLLCPRKLEPNILYHAFLVPSYETGRLAGLGRSPKGVKAQQAAWPAGDAEMPIYYRWQFRTGENFDFEYLVKLLEPRTMDKRIGQRPMDCSRPGFVQADFKEEVSATDPLIIQLQGALLAPTSEPTAFPGTALDQPFLRELEPLVNLNLFQQENPLEDPFVTVPYYGMYHAMQKNAAAPEKKIIPPFNKNQDNWYNDLNRDPRTRVPAGFGVRVIQENQERLMDAAWKQLRQVIEANKRMNRTQFTVKISARLYEKTIARLPQEQLLSTIYPLAARIKRPEGVTLRGAISNSILPNAIFKSTFRRMTRSNTTAFRALNKEEQSFQFNNLVQQINKEGGLSAAPVVDYQALSAVSALSNFAAPEDTTNIQVWSVQSNLDSSFIYNSADFKGAFPSAGVWDNIFDSNIIDIIINDDVIDIGTIPGSGGALPGGGIPGGGIFFTQNTVLSSPPGDPGGISGAYQSLGLRFTYHTPAVTPPSLNISVVASETLAALHPQQTFKKLLYAGVKWPSGIVLKENEDFLPAMAYPDFPEPTYKYLVDIDEELLLPNLSLIPPNTLSLLRTNQKFIESYLLGLNYEMGRELLWREYPTDMRGSYFRQFWDVKGFVTPETSPEGAEELKDIKPIHTWKNSSKLGSHNARDAQGDSEQLVFVIRGDLLKKFPNTVIYAQKAILKDGKKEIELDLEGDDFQKKILFPQYQAELPPDIKLLGFDLTIEEAAGISPSGDPADNLGWFFILAEVPGEPRFGMDVTFNRNKPNELTWNDLSWENFEEQPLDFVKSSNPPGHSGDASKDFDLNQLVAEGEWGKSSADMATILFQRPVMIAVHASEMLDIPVPNVNALLDLNTNTIEHHTLLQHIALSTLS